MIRRAASDAFRKACTGKIAPWIALAPFAFACLLLLAIPALFLFIISIYRNGLTFGGFGELLQDSRFSETFGRTLVYALVTVSFQVWLGLGCALYAKNKDSTFSALVFFLPYVVPSIVAVVMWRFAVEEKGILSQSLLRAAHIPAESWMGNWILGTLIIISVWQFYPFVFISLLARLRQIPGELYLSGQLDGAGHFRQFWHITLPALRSTLAAVVLLRLVFMATKFDTPWLLAGRTANRGASTFSIYVYENGFRPGGIRATPGAAAVVMVALGSALVIVIIHALRRMRRNA